MRRITPFYLLSPKVSLLQNINRQCYRNISNKLDRKINIFSTGVGPQGGDPGDAVHAGADFVIIGRSIYQAEDPREVVVQTHNLIKKAIKNMPYESA